MEVVTRSSLLSLRKDLILVIKRSRNSLGRRWRGRQRVGRDLGRFRMDREGAEGGGSFFRVTFGGVLQG